MKGNEIKMTKDEMLTLVIRKYGFEHKNTIYFAECLDLLDNAAAEKLLDKILSYPISEEEEDS